MVRIHADLRRKIESHREAGGAISEQVLVTLVGFLGIPHTGILAHGPKTAAIHGGLNATSKGEIAGVPDLCVVVGVLEIGRCVEGLDGDLGWGLLLVRSSSFAGLSPQGFGKSAILRHDDPENPVALNNPLD